MSVTATKPAGEEQRPATAWLRWGLSLVLVLGVHASALLLLRRTIPAMGPAAPEAILMDLAPEPTTPELLPETRQPLEPLPMLPPQPDPPPEPPAPEPPALEPPPPEPEAVPPIEDVAPLAQKAEVPLPPPSPPRLHPALPRPAAAHPRSRPTVTPPQRQVEAPPPVPQATAPGPAAATPPGEVQATWEARLLAHLARFKRFPPAAQRRGEQGVVLMRLTIARSGAVLAMSMARGSGYADLDEEAQAWLTRAQPVPPFPAEIGAQQMEIAVPLRFTLR